VLDSEMDHEPPPVCVERDSSYFGCLAHMSTRTYQV